MLFQSLTLRVITSSSCYILISSWILGIRNSFDFRLKSKQNTTKNKVLNFRNLMRVNVFHTIWKDQIWAKSRLTENHSDIKSFHRIQSVSALAPRLSTLCFKDITYIGPVCSYIKAIQFNCKFHQVLTLHFHLSFSGTTQNTKYYWMVSHTL